MELLDLIYKKRNGQSLTKDELEFLVNGIVKSDFPDYQLSAFLMAVYFQSLNYEETANLTLLMANSGEYVDLSAINGCKLDKHSTGGVGDKCTLIVAPLVASFDVPMAKLSGRGLGFTGGTVDKLESIESFNTSLTSEAFIKQVNEIKIVVAGQSQDLAPADKYLYALRDVTATVDSIPLIAASIMSKKIAGGADKILLDVTCGYGAFMKNYDQAKKLAEIMVAIGKIVKKEVQVLISSMDEPLGFNIGNILELQEAVDVLQNLGPSDTKNICCEMAARLLSMAGIMSYKEALIKCRENLANGKAYAKFLQFILYQNGELGLPWSGKERNIDIPTIEKLIKQILTSKNECHNIGAEIKDKEYDEIKALLLSIKPKYRTEKCHTYILKAGKTGYISKLKADNFGLAVQALGGGRVKKTDNINYSVGITLFKKCCDYVHKDENILKLYYKDETGLRHALSLLQDAVEISDIKPKESKLILDFIE